MVSPTIAVKRADIQVLRALAILAVVAYHLAPDSTPNGYLGVDIFFVLSGFLITGVLVKELDTGSLNLVRFFSRRARRLLPAALVTILVTTIAGYFLAPRSWWLETWNEAIASVFYFQNWLLFHKEIDYLQQDAAVSPFQHFWSLSVEEQFYLAWPVLLMAMFALKLRAGISLVLVVISLFSLLFFMSDDSAAGFFNSFGRIWEFGIGALIAINIQRLRPHWAAAAIGWILMVYAIWFAEFDNQIVSLIAVLGAGLGLLGAGKINIGNLLAFRVFGGHGFRPLVWVGDISYSLYLWHWPVIILTPWVIAEMTTASDWWWLFAISLVLATASKYLIEDPIRFGLFSKLLAPKQLWLCANAMVVVAIVISFNSAIAKADISNSFAETQLTPKLSEVAADRVLIEEAEFRVGRDDTGFITAEFGVTNNYQKHVALIGDSHARQYFNTLDTIAMENFWKLTVISKSACSIQDASSYALESESCLLWNESLAQHLDDVSYDLIINSNSTLVHRAEQSVAESFVSAIAGYSLRSPILVITDNPKPEALTQVNDYRVCIEQYQQQAAIACSIDISQALSPADSLASLLAQAQYPNVTVLDATEVYCPNLVNCPPVIENTIVYRDNSHVSVSFAEKLKPMIETASRELLGD